MGYLWDTRKLWEAAGKQWSVLGGWWFKKIVREENDSFTLKDVSCKGYLTISVKHFNTKIT